MRLPRAIGMGRSNHGAGQGRDGDKATISQMHINKGGYDNGGAYWGVGAPMWRVLIKGEPHEFYTRAATRFEAWLAACAFFGVQLRVNPGKSR